MIPRVTMRTELGASRALTARRARSPRSRSTIARDPDSRSGCASRVAMMQPADHRKGDDVPPIGGLALAVFGGVLPEREVGPEPMIVLEVLAQDAPQVLL